jgi:glutamyl-tRNA reductase
MGVSHKTAPVEVRERIAFAEATLPEALQSLVACSHINEGLIISTCNRVEIIAATSAETQHAFSDITNFLREHHHCAPQHFDHHLYQHAEFDAVHHLFRVTSSLDSMVVGEPQITGQVKEAYQLAQSANTLGHTLNSLMNRAFNVAKRVRTETGIGASAVSISHVAVELARKVFDSLKGRTVLLLGAGEMAELAAKHLMTQGAGKLLISSRTFENAQRLAEEMNGTAAPFAEMERNLAQSDIVICSTGAPDYVICPQHVRRALELRRNHPIFLIDISVPRNIDPAVSELDNAFVFDIDDLEAVAAANRQERAREALRAEEIIKAEAERFIATLAEGDLNTVIGTFRREMGALAFAELERSRKKLGDLSPQQEEALQVMLNAIVNKFTNPIIKQLRESEDGHSPYLKAFRDFYHRNIHQNDRKEEKE